MNIKRQKALGIAMLCELMLYCIYSIITVLVSKHANEILASLLSSALAVAVFLIPALLYTKIASVPFSELMFPNGKSANDQTRKSPNVIISFIFALAITVSAVNLATLATDAVFDLLGAPLEDTGALNAPELALIFLRNVLVAAIFEELLLRGVVLNATQDISDIKRVLLSALLFALIHCNLRSFFYAFAAGAVIAYFTLKSNSLILGVAIHFSQNCITFVFTVLSEVLKKNAYNLVSTVAFVSLLAIAVIGIVFTVIYERRMRCIAPADRENPKSRMIFSTELIAFTVAAALITAITF